jgi:transcriptional regulator with XRE-family HTH domain
MEIGVGLQGMPPTRDPRNETVRRNLILFRGQAGLTQAELATLAGVPLDNVRKYENGRQGIKGPTLHSLAVAMRRRMDDFLDENPPPGVPIDPPVTASGEYEIRLIRTVREHADLREWMRQGMDLVARGQLDEEIDRLRDIVSDAPTDHPGRASRTTSHRADQATSAAADEKARADEAKLTLLQKGTAIAGKAGAARSRQPGVRTSPNGKGAPPHRGGDGKQHPRSRSRNPR